jgi:sulfatase maturation enzyme AslB (radical SAM superfamily)
MPNIILTEYCNLKCPYCFANQMIDESNENNKNITIEQLQFILKWLTPTASKKDF